ncbi:helix-turn-helix transcriptional regulator [Klebsiella aerogenes]|uniref:helix-turn-helix transcriptional regulator n=1 Tax=Klebsiella aerogenes TaxID=548 RepID=UPI0037904548
MSMIIRDVVIWIESDLSRNMTAASIARRAGYTRWHLQKVFKEVTGMTLIYYLRMRRMTVAAELLRTTTLPVTAVYMRVGFRDGATFCRAFQRYAGVTPTVFRAGKQYYSADTVPPLFVCTTLMAPQQCRNPETSR